MSIKCFLYRKVGVALCDPVENRLDRLSSSPNEFESTCLTPEGIRGHLAAASRQFNDSLQLPRYLGRGLGQYMGEQMRI